MPTLRDKLEAGNFVATSELRPPKSTNPGPLLDEADALRARVDALDVTDAHGGRMALGWEAHIPAVVEAAGLAD